MDEKTTCIKIIQPTDLLMINNLKLTIVKSDLIWCKKVNLEKLVGLDFTDHYYIITYKQLGMVLRNINKVINDSILVSEVESPLINYKMKIENIHSLFEIEKIVRCAN